MLEPVKPRTISTSRWKLGLYLGLGLVFVTVGLVVGDSSKPRAFEVELFTILSALCCGLFAWLLVFPGRVLLHAEGFTVKGGFQLIPWTVRWGDVDAFVPLDYSRLGTVGFRYTRGYRHPSRRRFTRFRGADEVLPIWWRSSESVAHDLNAYRMSALAAGLSAATKVS